MKPFNPSMVFLMDPSYTGQYTITDTLEPDTKRIIPNSIAQTTKGDFGFYITQYLKEEKGAFLQHQWAIQEAITLQPYSEASNIIIHYMLQGSITGTLAGVGTIALEEGMEKMFYIPANAAQSATLLPGIYLAFQAVFSPEILQNFVSENAYLYAEMQGIQADLLTAQELQSTLITLEEKEIFQKIRLCTYQGVRREKFMESALYDLLAHYLAGVDKQRKAGHKIQTMLKRKMQPIVDYIEENLDETFTVLKLSKKAGLSEIQFRSDFKEYTGVVFKKYVRLQRLESARRMLVQTAFPVRDIALRCGFCDPSELNNQFKIMFNDTPLEFRKKN